MLSKPENGWSKLTIGDFTQRVSYINDVPLKLLDAIDYTIRTSLASTVEFDTEGYDFLITFTITHMHIILQTKDDYEYQKFDRTIFDISKEIISDIRENLIEWAEFKFSVDKDEVQERIKDLDVLCDIIERRTDFAERISKRKDI